MAMIICPECGHEVSENASFCPNCGNPRSNRSNTPVLIEQTGKIWKKIFLVSWFLIIFGIVIISKFYTPSGMGILWEGANPQAVQSSPGANFGSFLVLLGIFGLIFAKLGSWWYHR
jgi:hypothetical protein